MEKEIKNKQSSKVLNAIFIVTSIIIVSLIFVNIVNTLFDAWKDELNVTPFFNYRFLNMAVYLPVLLLSFGLFITSIILRNKKKISTLSLIISLICLIITTLYFVVILWSLGHTMVNFN